MYTNHVTPMLSSAASDSLRIFRVLWQGPSQRSRRRWCRQSACGWPLASVLHGMNGLEPINAGVRPESASVVPPTATGQHLNLFSPARRPFLSYIINALRPRLVASNICLSSLHLILCQFVQDAHSRLSQSTQAPHPCPTLFVRTLRIPSLPTAASPSESITTTHP